MRSSAELSQRKPFDSRINIEFTPKRQELSWTDHRIEQIKKKYETTHKKSYWPGSQVKAKTLIQDKQNEGKIVKKEQNQTKNQLASENCMADYGSHRQKLTQSSNKAHKDSQKEICTAAKTRNLRTNEKQSISAFQTDDNFYMKSALNQKLQAQSSQKINYSSSIRLFTDYCSSNKSRELGSKVSKREVHDHRIENIEKINSKIKQILQCIENCQQQELKSINMSQVELNRSRLNTFNLQKSNISRRGLKNDNNASQLQQTKILQRRKFHYPTENNASTHLAIDPKCQEESNKHQMRVSRSSSHFQQYLNKYKNRLNDHKVNNFVKVNTSSEGFMPRSSSCFQKKPNPDDNSDQKSSIVTHNVSHIDRQINKFQHKIQELQQRKRKMNIKFKPFEYERSPVHNPTKETQLISSKTRPKNTSSRVKTEVERTPVSFFIEDSQNDRYGMGLSKQENQKAQSKAIYRFIKDSIYPEKVALKQPEQKSLLQGKYNNTIQTIEIDQKQSIVLENIEVKNHKYYDNEDLRKKISDRMEQRKKMLEMIHNKIQQEESEVIQTHSFVKALCKQVCLDEDLRNSKNWFNEYSNPAKYQLLKSQLAKRGVIMSSQQIDAQFKTSNDIQNDPFFSFRQQKYTIQSLVLSYLTCMDFWQSELVRKWDFQKMLNNENLSRRLLKKNQITIEDIVRLINTETGNFYRNRDIYLIFERIKKQLGNPNQQTINIEQLKQVLGK